MRELGFAAVDEPPARLAAIADLVLLTAEPMHARGVYDYGTSDIAARFNRAKMDLLRLGYVRAPPAATLFLMRKFAGIYFLLHRLGARVDVSRVVAPFLDRTTRVAAGR